MKSAIKISVILIALFGALACASETTHREATEEMLIATGINKTALSVSNQVISMMEQFYFQMGLPQDTMPVFEKYSQQMKELLEAEMSWDKIKDDIVTAYMEVYTQEEVEQIAEFFKTPVGKKYVDTLPELTQKLIVAAQQNMQRISPQMQEITDKMRDELMESQTQQQSMPEAPPAPPSDAPAIEEDPAEQQ